MPRQTGHCTHGRLVPLTDLGQGATKTGQRLVFLHELIVALTRVATMLSSLSSPHTTAQRASYD